MHEIVQISLDNEMDLILAHKRSMKLGELCGLSVPAQTTFATAVSEISRCAIGHGEKSKLVLGINFLPANKKDITAILQDTVDLQKTNPEAFTYAQKLIGNLSYRGNNGLYEAGLSFRIPFGGTISEMRIRTFKEYFNNEPPLSPYDEIRKKNIQLLDLASKLQESEKQYRMLSDNLPLMMFASDNRGEIKFSNKWLRDMLSSNNIQPTNTNWVNLLFADDSKHILSAWEKAKSGKTSFTIEARLKSEGGLKWHLITVVPIKSDKETNNNWIGFFVDIQSQKLAEETLKNNKELLLAKKELESYQFQLEHKINELNISNRNLEQFAYIASHDLQEPLRKIITFSGLLQKELKLDEKETYHFNKIVTASQRMSALIKDVLNYSQLSTVDEDFPLENLSSVFEEVQADFDLLIAEKQATVIAEQLPAIHCKRSQMKQLFANMVSNSLKFSQGKPIIHVRVAEVKGKLLDVSLTSLDRKKDYWRLEFSDNGIGFDPQYNEQVFTIFKRLDDNKQYSGTGIGLALCMKIAENHGGTIQAIGNINGGATFHVFLPVVAIQ